MSKEDLLFYISSLLVCLPDAFLGKRHGIGLLKKSLVRCFCFCFCMCCGIGARHQENRFIYVQIINQKMVHIPFKVHLLFKCQFLRACFLYLALCVCVDMLSQCTADTHYVPESIRFVLIYEHEVIRLCINYLGLPVKLL